MQFPLPNTRKELQGAGADRFILPMLVDKYSEFRITRPANFPARNHPC
jgi:hypothetical protein